MADTYNSISNVAFVLAAVFFIVSAILFFRFNIVKIVGDLSGRNARKSINAMKNNINASNNAQQVIFSNLNTVSYNNVTGSTDSNNAQQNTDMSDDSYHTDILNDMDLLSTTVLGENESETTVLSQTELLPANLRFVIEEDITFIHTLEAL